MLKLVDTTIQSVRRISAKLRPVILDDVDVIPAIKWLAEDFQQRTEIKCDLDLMTEEDFNGSSETATAIFRIIQETFTNVIRHSKATKVSISLKRTSNELVFKILDNGN